MEREGERNRVGSVGRMEWKDEGNRGGSEGGRVRRIEWKGERNRGGGEEGRRGG
jgi:hypothetical protein